MKILLLLDVLLLLLNLRTLLLAFLRFVLRLRHHIVGWNTQPRLVVAIIHLVLDLRMKVGGGGREVVRRERWFCRPECQENAYRSEAVMLSTGCSTDGV